MSGSGGMTCRELVELVTEYLEGAMAPDDRARFEQHLALCPGCATYLEQMRRTIALVGCLAAESIPPRAQDELLRAFREWRAGREGTDPAS